MIHVAREVAELANQGVEGVKKALHVALRLEHAVIPPYLYALSSLKPDYNFDVIRIFRSILVEEMSHFALVANILNALDCTPRIDYPGFIPKYPGPLPGSVESGLIVPLQRFSKDLVRSVFAVIEEPEPECGLSGDVVTIGQFYRRIRDEILRLPRCAFKDNPARQVRTGFAPLQLIEVRDAESAAAAITEIVDQGEGENESVFDQEGELGHYYRLVEIYFERKLIFYPCDPPPASHSFENLRTLCIGHRIEFDPHGVEPAIDNPTSELYCRHPRIAAVNREFNRTYTRLLGQLQTTFEGNPDHLAVAMNTMLSLRDIARNLMSLELSAGVTAGPTFEYTA